MLKHPNIIQILSVQSIKRGIEIIMDYGGEDMRTYYNRTPYSKRVARVKQISFDILNALAYMHTNGIMHRDIKPDNILINKDVVKLCDFGLAKQIQGTQDTINICTLNYKPPELFSTEPIEYSFDVDIWSLGCLLHEFITKNMTFAGKREMIVLMNILGRIPTTKEDLQVLQLENIKIECCASEYKLPMLYRKSYDKKTICDLEKLDALIKCMLVLNPSKRISATAAISHSYFQGFVVPKPGKIKLPILARRNSKLNTDIRQIYVDSMFDMINCYDISNKTIFTALDIFDKYISTINARTKEGSGEIRNKLRLLAICSIMIASKYLDFRYLKVENFKTEYTTNQLLSYESKVLCKINYKLTYDTVLDIYYQLKTPQCGNIPDKLKDIVKNYNLIKNKNKDELEKLIVKKCIV